MYKSVALAVTLAVVTLSTPAAIAGSASSSKIMMEIDGKTRAVSAAQLRSQQPGALSAYRKAARAANALAQNSTGPLPAGCTIWPRFVSCAASGYWCAVGKPNMEWKFNCGRSKSKPTASRSFSMK